MTWYEIRLKPGVNASEFYKAVPDAPWMLFHHFWDEPWWPGAYVVRVQTEDTSTFANLPMVAEFDIWDASEDAQTFGPAWDYVSVFFMASAGLANQDPRMADKLVHCFLNSRGMSERDEARFAARFLWNRLTIKIRWRLYLRRRWERQKVVSA